MKSFNKKEYNKQWRKEHKEYIHQYNKQYRKEHLKYCKQYDKRWRKEHPGHHKEWYHKTGRSKRYRDENWGTKTGISYSKERKKLYRQKRAALEKRSDDLSIERIQLVYEDNIKKYGTLTCYLCYNSIKFSQDSIDHKIPLSRDGNNAYENLGIAHFVCNSRKHDKTEAEYRKWLIRKE